MKGGSEGGRERIWGDERGRDDGHFRIERMTRVVDSKVAQFCPDCMLCCEE